MKKSEGLEKDIIRHFPEDSNRLSVSRISGKRISFVIKDRYSVFLGASGILINCAGWLYNADIREGRIPEPLSVARLAAR